MKISIDQPTCIHELGKRSNQEDSVFPALGDASVMDKVFILCDGMGGHDNGELASSLVCNCLSDYIKECWDETFFSDQLLQKALDKKTRHNYDIPLFTSRWGNGSTYRG